MARLFNRTETQSQPAIDTSPAGEQERLIVEKLADLRTTDVREVMTPRLDVATLTLPVTADQVAQAVRETGHSCFPVIADELDDLVGVLYVTDLFRTNRRAGDAASEPSSLEISRRLREAYLIPESLSVLEALAEMRKNRRAFAVVVDEFGGVAGVLTIKDLLEPLVGELSDEFDVEEEPTIIRVDRTRWLVDGRATLDEVRETLFVPIDEEVEYVTFAGYLFDLFSKIPDEGDVISIDGFEFKIAEMEKRRIAKALVRRLEVDPIEGADSDEAPANLPSGLE